MTVATGQPMLASDILDLTFFPKGAILTFSSEAWNNASADFKKQWHICDGTNGTVNLVDRFPRGSGSTTGTIGGTDTAQVPYHTHTVSDSGHTHSINDPGHSHSLRVSYAEADQKAGYLLDASSASYYYDVTTTSSGTGISIKSSGSNISVQPAGLAAADNRPAFTTVIFIQKIA
jgi:hypothetical protein